MAKSVSTPSNAPKTWPQKAKDLLAGPFKSTLHAWYGYKYNSIIFNINKPDPQKVRDLLGTRLSQFPENKDAYDAVTKIRELIMQEEKTIMI